MSNERWTCIRAREDRRSSPMMDLKYFLILFITLNDISAVADDAVRIVCIAGYRHLFVRANVSASLDDLSSVIV